MPPKNPAPIIKRTGEVDIWRRLIARLRPVRWVMLALLLAALFLRFYQIGEPEVWLDELALRADAFAGTNKVVSRAHNAHLVPVGTLLRTFGNTPTVLRTWGAILCALGAVLCCVLGTWVRGPRVGVAFGIIAVVNPYLVLYSQDGNYYGGMFFYSVVQLCGLAALLRGGVKGGFLLMALAGVVSFYNHPMSICLTAMVLFGGLLVTMSDAQLRARIVPRWVPSVSKKQGTAHQRAADPPGGRPCRAPCRGVAQARGFLAHHERHAAG